MNRTTNKVDVFRRTAEAIEDDGVRSTCDLRRRSVSAMGVTSVNINTDDEDVLNRLPGNASPRPLLTCPHCSTTVDASLFTVVNRGVTRTHVWHRCKLH